jgi:lysozyme
MSIKANPPRQPADVTRNILRAHNVQHEIALVGVRGYRQDTMGVPGKNDIGIYDDAIFLVTPAAVYNYAANTDPGANRYGMATLRPGLWTYKLGMHGLSKPRHPSGTILFTSYKYQYEAFTQAGQVEVYRFGTENFKAGTQHSKFGYCLGAGVWRGWFGINIHCGGETTTSSEGCQTTQPELWADLHGRGKKAMQAGRVETIPYLLVIGPTV